MTEIRSSITLGGVPKSHASDKRKSKCMNYMEFHLTRGIFMQHVSAKRSSSYAQTCKVEGAYQVYHSVYGDGCKHRPW